MKKIILLIAVPFVMVSVNAQIADPIQIIYGNFQDLQVNEVLLNHQNTREKVVNSEVWLNVPGTIFQVSGELLLAPYSNPNLPDIDWPLDPVARPACQAAKDNIGDNGFVVCGTATKDLFSGGVRYTCPTSEYACFAYYIHDKCIDVFTD